MIKRFLRRIGFGLTIVVFAGGAILNGGLVYAAIPQEDLDAINLDTVWYKPGVSTRCSLFSTSTGTANPTEAQIKNAKIIIGVAKTENLGQQGALIGLMVGLAESGIRNLANSKIPVSLGFPNEGAGGDYDSVGIFQQRVATGWSTLAPASDRTTARSPSASQAYSNRYPEAINQIMTPAYAAEAFFGSPPGSNPPSTLSKGLQNIPNWQSLEPWVVAQKVQGSAFSSGSNYQKQMAVAQSLMQQYWDSSPPVPLPIPLTGGEGASDQPAALSPCSGISGNAQQLAQQILADKNINLGGRLARQDVEAAANNQLGSAGAMTSTAILQLILTVGQTHTVYISAIQSGGTGHCGGKPKSACPTGGHYNGDAVDFAILDGAALTGRDGGSLAILQIAFAILPSGTQFGQKNCGPSPDYPAGFSTFDDSCDHLHVQVPLGTP